MRELQNFKPSSRNASRRGRLIRACTTSLTLILTTLLAACATNNAPLREPVTRVIPDPPSYLQPVAVPPARVGASPYVVAEQRKQVIVQQNGIIVGARNAWQNLKATYGKSFVKKNVFGR